MSIIQELVSVFKFEGDVNPLKKAGDEMQRFSENTGIAEARTDSMGNTFLGFEKSTLVATAAIAAMAAGLAKVSKEIFGIGQQATILENLGIDPLQARFTEDLFVQLGSNIEDADNFTKKLAEAQNQLALNLDAPFARELAKSFGVSIEKGDTLNEVLDRLRKRVKDRGFTEGEISLLAGQIGFSPEFTRVLTATNEEFAAATQAIGGLTKLNQEQIKSAQEANDEMNKLTHEMSRLREEISVQLSPALINFLKVMRDGLKELVNLFDILSYFPDWWTNEVEPAFAKAINILIEDAKEFGKMVKEFFTGIWGGIKSMFKGIGNFLFDILDGLAKAISEIPVIGSGEFTPITRPDFLTSQRVDNSKSSSITNDNKQSVTINVEKMNTHDFVEMQRHLLSKQLSTARGGL